MPRLTRATGRNPHKYYKFIWNFELDSRIKIEIYLPDTSLNTESTSVTSGVGNDVTSASNASPNPPRPAITEWKLLPLWLFPLTKSLAPWLRDWGSRPGSKGLKVKGKVTSILSRSWMVDPCRFSVDRRTSMGQVMYCFDLHLPSFSLSKWPEEKDPKK